MIAMSSYKIQEPAKVVGFFHGIDLATQNDYYTDVVHVLTEKPKLDNEEAQRSSWNPFLVGIIRLKKMEPNMMMDTQIRFFNKFPPFRVHIDSTREEFLVNAMISKYGSSVVVPVKFMNSGSSNTKFQLKQIGYSFLNGGYQWPDDHKLEKTHPRLARLIRILKKEMIHEQMQYTDSGRITFNEPAGRHNDLVHGWELSLKAVMEFQEKNLGYERRNPENAEYSNIMEDIYKDYPTEELMLDEVFDRSAPSIAMKE